MRMRHALKPGLSMTAVPARRQYARERPRHYIPPARRSSKGGFRPRKVIHAMLRRPMPFPVTLLFQVSCGAWQ